DLGGKVTIARSKDPISTLVGIRKYPTGKAEEILPKSRKLSHLNIVRVLDAFVTNQFLYLVFEDMRLSLEHLVVSPAYPTSLQLGTILGQVLDGLNFIQGEGYGHGSLNCGNILINDQGCVKVGGQELCQITSPDLKARDIFDFGKVMMKLMQKVDRKDGKIGVDDPSRWQDNPDTMQFASSVASTRSLKELRR
ncbi:kinase-like domain-containing protein, partial [Mariannaea sp. PMI_226]